MGCLDRDHVLGILLVLLSSAFFCFQNVIVRILFHAYPVFGLATIGGLVSPSLHHSFLLMLLRMVLVVPLMAVLAPRLYPPIWSEVAQLRQPDQRPLLRQTLVCGSLMFLYLALLYVSIGLIPTGIALTLFFTYPVFTALLSWHWFGDRPTLLRWLVMILVMVGSALTMPHTSASSDSSSLLGIITGVGSGVAYAFYTVLAQKSFQRLHPVSFTWLSFALSLVLTAGCLLVWQIQEAALPWPALWVGGLLSAIFTLGGHLLNNLGIRRIGATAAAMVGATNPALTVVLAWFAIQETLSALQIGGVAIVTLSVALLGREYGKAKSHTRPQAEPSPRE